MTSRAVIDGQGHQPDRHFSKKMKAAPLDRGTAFIAALVKK
jgi:hypothetical protein